MLKVLKNKQKIKNPSSKYVVFLVEDLKNKKGVTQEYVGSAHCFL